MSQFASRLAEVVSVRMIMPSALHNTWGYFGLLIIGVLSLNTPVFANNSLAASPENGDSSPMNATHIADVTIEPPATVTASTQQLSTSSTTTTTLINSTVKPWYDRTHSYLSSYADSPAIWFDRFFVNEELGESILHEPSMRWQLWSVNTYDSELGGDVDVKLRARVDLPKLEAWAQRHIDTSITQRFQLVINDSVDPAATESEQGSDGAGEDSLIDDEERRFSSALRWLLQKDTSFLSVDVGARSSHVYIQEVIAKNGRLGKRWFAHAEQSFRWRSNEGLDAYLQGTFERRISPQWVFRQLNTIGSQEPFNDSSASHAFVLYQQFSDKAAMRYKLSAQWRAEHWDLSKSAEWTSVFSSVQLRHRLYRDWLFVELEPFVRWARDESFSANAGAFLRFELLFARDL